MSRRVFVDLEKLGRSGPGGESPEHYVLKHVARAWTWASLGIRVVGMEVDGFDRHWGRGEVPVTAKRYLVGRRLRELLDRVCPVCGAGLLRADASLYCTNDRTDPPCQRWYLEDERGWWTLRSSALGQEPRVADVAGVGRRRAGTEFPGASGQTVWSTRVVEVKVSRADYRRGFCRGADYTYVMTPAGLLEPEEVPRRVGLVEVNMDELRVWTRPTIGVEGVRVVKRTGLSVNPRFKTLGQHQRHALYVMSQIARNSTIEAMERMTVDGG